MIDIVEDEQTSRTRLLVMGIGGGGARAMDAGAAGPWPADARFVVMDTDLASLASCRTPHRVQLGRRIVGGQGTSATPALGRRAAEDDRERIARVVRGADVVVLVCGLGGGTGTGASPLIAEVCRASGARTIAVVTRPFPFEGRARDRHASEGLAALREAVHSLVVVTPPDVEAKGGRRVDPDPLGALRHTFGLADDAILQAVREIAAGWDPRHHSANGPDRAVLLPAR